MTSPSSTVTRGYSGGRSANGKIALRVPADVIRAKCAPYRRHGKPWHRERFQNLDDYDIVRIYGAEYRGIVNYYLLATNVGRLAVLRWNAETSMLKTLAAKHHSSVAEDSSPLQGQNRDQRRKADLLRGRQERGQKNDLSTIRRDTSQARHARGHYRSRAAPGPPAAQGANPQAPQAVLRTVRGPRHGRSTPGRRLAELGKPGPPAWMGSAYGANATQDTRCLRHMP